MKSADNRQGTAIQRVALLYSALLCFAFSFLYPFEPPVKGNTYSSLLTHYVSVHSICLSLSNTDP